MAQDILGKPALERYQDQLIPIFKTYFGQKKAEVYLYGSRAKGTAHQASDIDIAVNCSDLSTATLSKIREALHESHIPYKTDLVDLNTAGKAFKKSIKEEGILIWKN